VKGSRLSGEIAEATKADPGQHRYKIEIQGLSCITAETGIAAKSPVENFMMLVRLFAKEN
jgi:hypothetical protein